MSSQRLGFTLIEVLVVVTIILILAAIIVPTVNLLSWRAKRLVTTQRMEAISTALQGRYARDGGPAFGITDTWGLNKPLAAAVLKWTAQSTHADWTGYADTAALSVRTQCTSAGVDPQGTQVLQSAWGRPPLGNPAAPPAARTIRQMTPLLTYFFLHEAQIVPRDDPATPAHDGLSAFQTDRGSGKAWNDRWGNPLLVAYQLFEPTDQAQWPSAIQQYGVNRILYIATAAAGPGAPRPADNSVLPVQWAHVLDVFSDGDASKPIWDETGFANPPWEGITDRQTNKGRCILSAPTPIR